MSDTNSFIEEVNEEVRRDRVYGMIRRYGWIAAVLVVGVVGAAAWNEVRKSQIRADAEMSGDVMIAAVEATDNDARVAALKDVQTPSADAQIIADFLLGAHQQAAGDNVAAAETLEAIATSGGTVPEIYRQIASFKAILAAGSEMPAQERRVSLEAMASPGMPLALLAQEQLALLDIEDGQTDAAIARLEALIADANVTAGLRQRATQLMVALGGDPSAVASGGVDQ